ncbi:hypothetical protein D3C76_1726270 [compost metagenome]
MLPAGETSSAAFCVIEAVPENFIGIQILPCALREDFLSGGARHGLHVRAKLDHVTGQQFERLPGVFVEVG